MTTDRIWQIAGWTMLHYFWVGSLHQGCWALGRSLAVAICVAQHSLSSGARKFVAHDHRACGHCRYCSPGSTGISGPCVISSGTRRYCLIARTGAERNDNGV